MLVAVGMIFLIFVRQDVNLMLVDGIIYFVLAVQLLFLNFILIHTMRKMFGEDYAEKNFKNERRFLMVTMIFFSLSYLFISAKSIAGYIIFYQIDENWSLDHICGHNFQVVVFNSLSVFFVDILPLTAIFCLHFSNFLKEAKKCAMMEAIK